MRVIFFTLFSLFLFTQVDSQVCINEFLSSNVNGIIDEDGEYSDWIEVYNKGASVSNLSAFSLSDEINVPAKWTFPQLELSPGGHILVFASGKDRRILPLTYQTIIDMGDEWHYLLPGSGIGNAWQESGFDDAGWPTGPSGFGYADDDDATIITSTISVFIRKEFTVTNLSDINRLILSIDYDDGFVAYINGHEVARANLGTPGEDIAFDRVADASHEALIYLGSSPEYFEISNPGSILIEGTNTIAIQGHNNSISSSDLSLIPFLTVGRLSAGIQDVSPLLSFSSGAYLHTNFKLDADGESFYLFQSGGTLVDSVGAMHLLNDVSYGRKPDGTSNWRFFSEPTPGEANSTNGVQEIQSNPVTFSPLGGKHIGGVSITLSTLNAADTIYYTSDGSIPDKSDQRYTGPFLVNSSQVIRARVIKFNTLPGPVGVNSYIISLNHDLPIVCLSTEPANLWDDMTGIYAYGPNPGLPTDQPPYSGANFWQDWERPVHIELYDVQGTKRIDQDAGIKIAGGWSRLNDQKSFALYARKEYGKGAFNYKFFADKPIDKFESILLRNSGNDNMGLQFHDCFMTGLTREMNIDRQAFQPAAVYINGTYWGLLNIREKVSKNFIAENYHVDPDSVNLLEGGGQIVTGSNHDYTAILNFLNVNTTLQNNSNYYWVRDKIDLDNFIQYQLTEIYINNRDWPGNNIKFWNTTSPESKWRWILYDTDFGFGIGNTTDYTLNTLEFALDPNGPGWPNPPWSTLFLRRMVTNQEFRNNFITQYCDRLNLDFYPDRVLDDLDSLQALYDHEIVYNFNRWWGTYEEWLGRIHNRKVFGLYRPDYCRQHMQQVFSLGNEMEIIIDVSDSQGGSVKLNTIYPKSFPFTGIYFEDIPIRITAIPKIGYKFVRWEGTINSTSPSIEFDMSAGGNFKAFFTEASAADISIVINEINYNSSPERDTKDWVELVNNGLTSVDLNGWLLSDSGPDSGYFFSQGMSMAPGDFLVICRDLEKFRDFNPGVINSVGDMPFGLGSSGDMLRLYNPQSSVMDAVDYYIYSPWPENANGTGASIELIDPSLDNTRGENWQAIGIGGTPGKANFGTVGIQAPAIPDALVSGFDCFPNPFSDYTTIRFTVAAEGHYRLEVIDINGRIVNVLADEYLAEGSYWIDWTGANQQNTRLEGGVYTVRLVNEKNIETIKIIMLK
jgi:hypothetical protein